MNRQTLGQAAFGLALFFCGSPLTHAGAFTVNPVRVTLSPTQAVAAITVTNAGKEASVIQLETSRWTQQGTQDVLAPSSEILATPPIFTLPPGGSQIVRIGMRRPPDVQHEVTYRLLLREVPPPQPIAQGLRVALAISMPVFVVSAHPAFSNLQWQATRLADGSIHLQATNTGTAHVQIGTVTLSTQGSAAPAVRQSVATYVLPGNTRDWTLKSAVKMPIGSIVRLRASTDAGDVQASVTLGSADAQRPPGPVSRP